MSAVSMQALMAATAASAYTPAANSPLGWWDVSVKASLFKDVNGTDPVVNPGDPVARVSDLSGFGNHLLQATSSRRPIYRASGGLAWLELDGVDDALRATFSYSRPASRVTCVTQRGWRFGDIILDGSAAYNEWSITQLYASANIRGYANGGGTMGVNNVAIGTPFVIVERQDTSASDLGVNSLPTTTTPAGNNALSGLSISTRGGGVLLNFSQIDYYGGAVFPSKLSNDDLTKAYKYFGQRGGLTL